MYSYTLHVSRLLFKPNFFRRKKTTQFYASARQLIKPASLTNRCLTAGAEDYIVKPLRKKDVQRLRNCSAARSATKDAVAADDRRWSSVKKNDAPAPPPRPDTAAKKATSEQRPRRLAGAGLAMASTVDLSHYLQFLFKFILLAYAVLCLTELLHRWSSGCFLSQLP
jgi:two-component response regulator (ARR-A family)